jgi:hypothetical protein
MLIRGIMVKNLFVILLIPLVLLSQERAFKALPTNSEKRVALVIGNGAYTESPLKNPPNDARAMASTLQELGFNVISRIDANQKEMKRAIREFGQAIKGGGVSLFYYAGHGIQSGGENYLIPIGSDIQKEQDIDIEAIRVQSVLAEMDVAGDRMNIVVLDACRNNPFSGSFRSMSRGLTQLLAPAGTYIAFATAPGSIAADGDGANGIYTQALLQEIKQPGQQLEEVFKNVLSTVKKQTNGRQIPWTSSSVEGNFYFSGKSSNEKDIAKDVSILRLINSNPSGERTINKSKDPKCQEKNTGDYCFQNDTKYNLTIHFDNRIYTIQPGQKQYFYNLPAGEMGYDINSKKPAYYTWPPTADELGYHAKGSLYVESCVEKTFIIK